MSDTKHDPAPCPCQAGPMNSPCCRWPGNESLCVCADYGIVIQDGQPAPS